MTKALPLDGITVVDFSQILAGPFCTMMLADMGIGSGAWVRSTRLKT